MKLVLFAVRFILAIPFMFAASMSKTCDLLTPSYLLISLEVFTYRLRILHINAATNVKKRIVYGKAMETKTNIPKSNVVHWKRMLY